MRIRGMRLRPSSVLLVLLVLANVVILAAMLSRQNGDGGPGSERSVSLSNQERSASKAPRPGASSRPAIRVEHDLLFADTFETVRVDGRYAGAPNTQLTVQYRARDGWLSFPLPVRTDRSGSFRAHVEMGVEGRYTLRVLDPGAGVTSEKFILYVG
jgi:hypothetical protein